MTTDAHVAIVGAGLTGLAIAYELQKQGVATTIYEASDRLGGVIGSHQVDGFIVEQAAPAFRASADGVFDLATELGLEPISAEASAKTRWLLTSRGLEAIPMSPPALIKSSLLSARQKMRLLREPFIRSTSPEGESVYDFFARRFGKGIADTFAVPMVSGIFAADPRDVAVRAAFPDMLDLETQGGIIRGARKKMKAVPQERKGLQSFGGGMETLLSALAQSLAGKINLSSPVTQVRGRPSGVTFRVGGEEKQAAALVLTTPVHLLSGLLSHSTPTLDALAETKYATVTVVACGFASDDVLINEGFGFLSIVPREDKFLGAVFESAVWPNRAADDAALIRCMLGDTCEDPQQTIERCIEVLRAGKVIKSDAVPKMTRVFPWEKAIATMDAGHLERVSRADEILSTNHIHIAGGSTYGVGLNYCCKERKRVVPRVLAGLGVTLAALCACSGSRQVEKRDEAPPTSSLSSIGVSSTSSSESSRQPLPTNPITITTEWKDPPAALRRSAGMTPCKSPLPATVSVHTLGGVHEAVVSVRPGKPRQTVTPRLVIEACLFKQRVVVAAPPPSEFILQSLDERTHIVKVDGVALPSKTVEFPAAGSAVRLKVEKSGIVSLTLGQANAWVYVPQADESAQVVDSKGRGTVYATANDGTAAAWHPGDGKAWQTQRAVTINGEAKVTLPLKQ